MAQKKKSRVKVKVLKDSIQVSIDITDVLKKAVREIAEEKQAGVSNEERNQDH